ncbi:MAG: D-3-phosphoglycerate dehydrogenase [Phycisphaerae bacterium]|nr:D-3-phosphoglycerate dehydrogenase [Phycisphaerae bacterium]
MAETFRVLIADKLADEGLALLRADERFQIDIKTGQSEAALAELVGRYDALIVRSGAKITAAILQNPGKLRVISRAGVGVDNIDLPAATRAGVLVINTPDANTLSTAEHAFAMMLALARRIVPAHQHLASGGWERGRFNGLQLAGKTLGIVGFGRIGRAVAARALAFEMSVIAFDPLMAEPTALGGRVRIVRDLRDVLRQSDFVTLHAALTPQTRALIDAAALAVMKPTATLVNCARGELVDEAALAEALKSSRLAGAAIDVFSAEPPLGNPLVGLPNVIHTPHLGASTNEAQLAVTIDAVNSVIEVLRDGVVRNAVNVVDLPHDLTPTDLAHVDLAERIGRLLAAFCEQGVQRVRVVVAGESLARLGTWLGRHVLLRLLHDYLAGPVSVVNILEVAAQRSIRFDTTAIPEGPASVRVEVESGGVTHSAGGVLIAAGEPRLRSLNGHALDMTPRGHMVVVQNDDRPGAIGLVATQFGDAEVNIADLAVSRQERDAMMLFKIDGALPRDVLERLRTHRPPIRAVYDVELPDWPAGQG